MQPIEFPGFGININPSRVAFTIGSFPIYWYGIIIAAGFLLAVLYATKRAPSFGISENDLLDLMIFGVPVSIIFARLYYVVFNFHEFSGNLSRVFSIWEGGIAVYGSIIGAILTVIVGCRIKKMNPWALLDLVSLSFLIGQCIGRWGNFINREAYGTPTDLPWRMLINGHSAHPTFLYESLLTLTGFIVLHFVSKRRKFNGQIFLMYAAWYGLGRGIIEGLRTDSLFFFGTGLRISQFLGFASCLAALGVLFYQFVFVRRDGILDGNGQLIVANEEDAEENTDDEDIPAEIEDDENEDDADGDNN